MSSTRPTEKDNRKLEPPLLRRIYKDEIDCVGIDVTRFIAKEKNKTD